MLGFSGDALPPGALAYFERRFGHDFSGVRVHTDARAADSAHQVHAHAYTVGQHIVFGANKYAPQTPAGQRLIAHELAHVVQQSTGAVRGGALQRKPTADDTAAIASIRAAQHEIDELNVKLAAGKSAFGLEPLTNAARHMDHARAALDTRHGEELAAAYKSYRAALQACEQMSLGLADADSTRHYLFTYLWVEDEQFWAREFGLPETASKKDFKTTIAGKDRGDGTTGMSAAEALNLLAFEARQTFDLLAEGKDRELTVVGARSNMHRREAEYAAWVMQELDEHARSLLKDEIEAASQPLAAIRHWLHQRTGTRASIDAFQAVERAINSVRKTAKLGDLETVPVPTFYPAGEEAEATDERGRLDSALLAYATEVQQTYGKALFDGIQDWFELAREKDQAKPDFMRNLLGFAATALLGNLAGVFAKQFLLKMKDAFKANTVDVLSGSIKDVTKSVAGPMLAKGDEEADGVKELKPLQFMRGALNQGIGSLITNHVADLTAKKDDKNLSTAEVVQATAKLKEMTQGAQQTATLDAAVAWSRYVAQAGLKKARGQGDEARDPAKNAGAVSSDVTDLRDDYFGTPREVASGVFTKETVWDNNRKGTAGVMRVEIKHQHRPRHMSNDPPELLKVDINGMNAEMAKLAAAKGGNILGQIPVPKEILIRHFHFGSIGNYNTETSLIAVDEKGVVTDYVGDGAEMTMNGVSWWSLIKDFDVSGKIE